MNKDRFHATALAAVIFTSSCAGCFGCPSPVKKDGSNLPPECSATQPTIEPQKLDILFVVDNSGSMAEEQAGVATEVSAFIQELRKGGGVSQDFHVGLITTAVYQRIKIGTNFDFTTSYSGSQPSWAQGAATGPVQAGKLQPVPEADGGVGTERFLTGDDPELVEKIARLVKVGTTGSGQETPFEAVRLALFDLDRIPLANGGNGGFLRDRARLLVVVLTDEDDCSEMARPPKVYVGNSGLVDDCTEQGTSLTTVSEYHRMFTEELKDSNAATRELIWTVIGPVSNTPAKAAMAVIDGTQVRNIDCPTSNEPGHRHRKMAEMFDTQLVNLDSICRPSYRDTLLAIAGLANITQTLEIKAVPDPQMLQVVITRRDDSVTKCGCTQWATNPDGSRTCEVSGGLARYEPPKGSLPGKVFFGPDCRRRADDKKIEMKMLCLL